MDWSLFISNTCDSIVALNKLTQAAFSDRGLSIISTVLSVAAIFLGLWGIWRSEYLFKKLDDTLSDLVENAKTHALRQMTTVSQSYAAFARALQAVDLKPLELPKDGAFALLTSFHFQKLLQPSFTPEEFSELRKLSRKNVEKSARDYVDMLIQSGLATMKPGIELNEPPEEKA